ncbi:MAG: leucine-rich repeat domain-containing protein [Planctomycetia bacterium]
MRTFFGRSTTTSRRRALRRRETFNAQFDGGSSAAAFDSAARLGCDILEQRIVLTASPDTDFDFSKGTIMGYHGLGGAVEIPSIIQGIPVVAIAKGAFQNNQTITRVVIPGSVAQIGEEAFAGDNHLASVIIRKGVRFIDDHAFSGTALESVALPESVKAIGTGAFADIPTLKSARLGDGLVTIGALAFNRDSNLTRVTFGRSVATIGDGAFQAAGLLTVSIPKSTKTIGWSAFADNPNLKSAIIGNGVESIGSYTFQNDRALASIVIGRSLTAIGEESFSYTGLKAVVIPDNVKTIQTRAFFSCQEMERATIGNGVEEIGVLAFADSGKLQRVTLGQKVGNIGDGAFQNADLGGVVIPDSVKRLGWSSFAGNSHLASATLGKSVASIGNFVFQDDTELKKIRFRGDAPAEVADKAFLNVHPAATLLRTPKATGFGADEDLWNGLLVWTDRRQYRPEVQKATFDQASSTVTIEGKNFLKSAVHNEVKFSNGAHGTVEEATPTRLKVHVDTFAHTDTVKVQVQHVGGPGLVAAAIGLRLTPPTTDVTIPFFPYSYSYSKSNLPLGGVDLYFSYNSQLINSFTKVSGGPNIAYSGDGTPAQSGTQGLVYIGSYTNIGTYVFNCNGSSSTQLTIKVTA